MIFDQYFKRETYFSKKISKYFYENLSKITIFEEMILQE